MARACTTPSARLATARPAMGSAASTSAAGSSWNCGDGPGSLARDHDGIRPRCRRSSSTRPSRGHRRVSPQHELVRRGSVKAGDGGRGRMAFEGKGGCARCHRVGAQGSRVAPDLSEIGAARSPDRRALADRPDQPDDAINTSRARRHARRQSDHRPALNEDTYTVQLPTSRRGCLAGQSRPSRVHDPQRVADAVVKNTFLPMSSGFWRTCFAEGTMIRDATNRRLAGSARDLMAATCRVQAQVGSDRLRNAAREARNWLMYSGGYFSHRYSSDAEPHTPTPGTSSQMDVSGRRRGPLQTTPLVVDGVMYLTQRSTTSGRSMRRPDASSGSTVTRWIRPLIVCCGANNAAFATSATRSTWVHSTRISSPSTRRAASRWKTGWPTARAATLTHAPLS